MESEVTVVYLSSAEGEFSTIRSKFAQWRVCIKAHVKGEFGSIESELSSVEKEREREFRSVPKEC